MTGLDNLPLIWYLFMILSLSLLINWMWLYFSFYLTPQLIDIWVSWWLSRASWMGPEFIIVTSRDHILYKAFREGYFQHSRESDISSRGNLEHKRAISWRKQTIRMELRKRLWFMKWWGLLSCASRTWSIVFALSLWRSVSLM